MLPVWHYRRETNTTMQNDTNDNIDLSMSLDDIHSVTRTRLFKRIAMYVDIASILIGILMIIIGNYLYAVFFLMYGVPDAEKIRNFLQHKGVIQWHDQKENAT